VTGQDAVDRDVPFNDETTAASRVVAQREFDTHGRFVIRALAVQWAAIS
jgi:hypothetical protein